MSALFNEPLFYHTAACLPITLSVIYYAYLFKESADAPLY